MNQSVTTSVFKDYFPSNVTAYISDRMMDFALNEEQTDLTRSQKKFLSKQLGFDLPTMVSVRQVHGNKVVVVKNRPRVKDVMEDGDGIVTDIPNLAIAIRTADCVPIFIHDCKKQVVGLVHAGWKGTQKKILEQAITAMRKNFQSEMQDIFIAFGPAIKSCCYRVGSDFQRHFPEDVIRKEGGYYLDLVGANRRQLLGLRIPAQNIYDSTICTSCDKSCFSFRREKESAGRMISVMVLHS